MKNFNKNIKQVTIICVVAFFFSSYISRKTGVNQTEYLIYASFMSHMALNTQWPETKRTGSFVIGVVGASPIEIELKKLAKTKKIGGREILIKRFKSSLDLSGCHMVFVPKDQHSLLASVSDKSKSMNALVITESAPSKDFVFNFIKINGKPRFEYNKTIAAANGVVVSPNLVKLSIQVN